MHSPIDLSLSLIKEKKKTLLSRLLPFKLLSFLFLQNFLEDYYTVPVINFLHLLYSHFLLAHSLKLFYKSARFLSIQYSRHSFLLFRGRVLFLLGVNPWVSTSWQKAEFRVQE